MDDNDFIAFVLLLAPAVLSGVAIVVFCLYRQIQDDWRRRK
jgi:hypothetical protein